MRSDVPFTEHPASRVGGQNASGIKRTASRQAPDSFVRLNLAAGCGSPAYPRRFAAQVRMKPDEASRKHWVPAATLNLS